MIWRENNFYEPEDDSIGELKMITVMGSCSHAPELLDDTAICFEISFSKIHSDILGRIAAHFEINQPAAVKMLVDAGMADCLGGVSI